MGYQSCTADTDLWLKPEGRPIDGFDYYSYILCYVDYILCIHNESMDVLNKLYKYFKLKPESTGDLEIYIGDKIRQISLINGAVAWGIIPSKYVRKAANNCANHVKDKFPGKYTFLLALKTPLSRGMKLLWKLPNP